MEKTIDIDKILKSKLGTKAKFVPGFLVSWLKKTIHEDEVNRYLWESRHETGTEWLEECVRYLDMTLKIVGKENLWYYRDFPHSYKKRAKSQVVAQLEDYELKESVSVAEFHDVKWDLAKKFYKSQSGLLWFEQGYIKKQLPEDIYVKKL